MMEALRAQVVDQIEAIKGGWCEVARRAGMDRTGLYRSFKMRGRCPTLKTLLRVLPHIGLELTLSASKTPST